MPKAVDITVHCIAQTRINRREMREWLDTIGAKEWEWESPGSEFTKEQDEEFQRLQEFIDSGGEPADTQRAREKLSLLKRLAVRVTDAAVLIGNLGRSCYRSFGLDLNPNVTRIREKWTDYFENVLSSRHGSIFEHANWTLAIEGCTRVLSAEFNRHRAGVAVSEQSLRYVRFTPEEIPFWMPTSIRGEDTDLPIDVKAYVQGHGFVPKTRFRALSVEQKKHLSRIMFFRAFGAAAEHYQILNWIWEEELDEKSKFKKKKEITSMMRRTIPMGVSTGVVYTINGRALRHILTVRGGAAAEEEIYLVATMIAQRMLSEEPHIFGDFEQDEKGFWMPKFEKV